MIRATLFFSGTVQNVGCRFATQQAASQLKLVGTVRNLNDGRVEVICEGDEDTIRQLPERVASRPGICITSVEMQATESVTGQFTSFEILR